MCSGRYQETRKRRGVSSVLSAWRCCDLGTAAAVDEGASVPCFFALGGFTTPLSLHKGCSRRSEIWKIQNTLKSLMGCHLTAKLFFRGPALYIKYMCRWKHIFRQPQRMYFPLCTRTVEGWRILPINVLPSWGLAGITSEG